MLIVSKIQEHINIIISWNNILGVMHTAWCFWRVWQLWKVSHRKSMIPPDGEEDWGRHLKKCDIRVSSSKQERMEDDRDDRTTNRMHWMDSGSIDWENINMVLVHDYRPAIHAAWNKSLSKNGKIHPPWTGL